MDKVAPSQSIPPPLPSARPGVRLVPLDGLRGIAALVVFAHHAMALLYGPLAGISQHRWPARPALALAALQHLPIGWMFNGAFAVSFFFVLSGFVLTLAVGAQPEAPRIARLMTYRILRLSPLVIIATLLGYALYEPGVHSLDMLRCVSGNDSGAYIAPTLAAHHGFLQAVRQLGYDIWRGARPDALFAPPLWSIGVELQGSLLVYLLAVAFGRAHRRSAKYLVGVPIGLCLVGPAALCFLAGMWIAESSREDGVVLKVRDVTLSMLLGGVALWASVHPWDRHLWLPLPFNPPELLDTCIGAACSVALIAAGLQLPGLRRALESGPIKFLGHASYGLYVVHVPLLYALVGPLFSLLRAHAGFHAAAIGATSIILALSLVSGALLVTYVDTPLSHLSKKWVTRWLDAREPARPA
ncbi:MAG TPA: acyltransferase [Myxococcota bacterium]|nr:acyltransferase [Myxococcota bacterium]